MHDPAAGFREQLDAGLCAVVADQCQCEAAVQFFARARAAAAEGDAGRAQRLLEKARRLDPSNPDYQTALWAASQGGAPGGGSSAAPAAAAGTRSSHEQRRDPQQTAAQEDEAAAALQAALAREKARRARQTSITCALLALASCCGAVTALVWMARLAPPAGPPAPAGNAWWRRAVSGALAAAAYLPRILFWRPTWAVAALWAAACACACTSLHCALRSWAARPRDAFAAEMTLALMAGWHPLLWRACGGGWGAVAITAVEVVPALRPLMGSDPLTCLLYVPLACLALRTAARRLLLPLLRAVAAPPLLWLWRGVLWQPRWWLSWAAAAVCVYKSRSKGESHARGLWATAATVVGSWWTLGGGWWAVAHLAAHVAGLALLVAGTGAGRRRAEAALPHLPALSAPILLARLAVALVWGGGAGRTWLCGLMGAALGALHWANLGQPRDQHGRGGSGGGQGAAHPVAGVQHLSNVVPAGAPVEVARILQAGNYYQVLGLGSDADEAAVRRAKRALSLATHPDKVGAAPGAADAFTLVTEACEVLGDPEARRQYDAELADASLSASFNLSPEDLAAQGIPPEFADRFQDFVQAVEQGDIPQRCSVCGDVHFLRRTDRPMAAARQCDECGVRHAVRGNEVWFESASAGLFRRTILMFCCHKGVVYDMSELGACEGMLRLVHERGIPLNRHVNPFKGFGMSTSGGGKRRASGSNQQASSSRSHGQRGGGSKKKGKRR